MYSLLTYIILMYIISIIPPNCPKTSSSIPSVPELDSFDLSPTEFSEEEGSALRVHY